MMKENSKAIFYFVKDATANGELPTADVIAENVGLTLRQVIGSVNAFVKKGLMEREEKQLMNDEGKYVTYKFIKMTEAGFALDPEAE